MKGHQQWWLLSGRALCAKVSVSWSDSKLASLLGDETFSTAAWIRKQSVNFQHLPVQTEAPEDCHQRAEASVKRCPPADWGDAASAFQGPLFPWQHPELKKHAIQSIWAQFKVAKFEGWLWKDGFEPKINKLINNSRRGYFTYSESCAILANLI